MTVIVVANPKGGVGKSTLSTNLAGYFAAQGARVALADLDVQQSASAWLRLRSPALMPIETWQIDAASSRRPPRGFDYVIVDTPAGLQGADLDFVLACADKVMVPLQPSMFDILASEAFFRRLLNEKAVRKGAVEVGIVGMRVDARTHAAEQLHHFVEGLTLPVLGFLRDTQNYIQLAAHGLTFWDVSESRIEKDLEQWQPRLAWAQK